MEKKQDKVFTRKFFQNEGRKGGEKNIELYGTKRMKRISQKAVESKKLKKLARVKLHYEILTGRMKRKPCIECNNPNSHGHHIDYSKPLEVIWLCSKHHGEKHRRGSKNPMNTIPLDELKKRSSNGGKETVKRKGREYMSEIGKRGRAKQLKDSRK